MSDTKKKKNERFKQNEISEKGKVSCSMDGWVVYSESDLSFKKN